MLDSRRVLGEQRETRRAHVTRDDSNGPTLGQVKRYNSGNEVNVVAIIYQAVSEVHVVAVTRCHMRMF
jgi:hypothetical protein